jgi:anti-sigma factor RsiW
MSACPPSERLLAFLCGELPDAEQEALEEHLFGCTTCASEVEGLARTIAAVRSATPPVFGRSVLEALQRRAYPLAFNPMRPGQHAEVTYPAPGSLLVHRLSGLDLARARRVDVKLETAAGAPLGLFEDVPFDADHGEVLLACQAHYAEMFPPDVVFVLQAVGTGEPDQLARYSVLHRAP